MDAYTLVDPYIRRKFEELLSTWKEPPPTGVTSAPVFPVEMTRRIENALLKAKTLALQLEQRRHREIAGLASYRNTPPIEHAGPLAWQENSVLPVLEPLAPTLPNVYPLQTNQNNQELLLNEIRNLLANVTRTLLLNPADEAARTQANALNSLQTILQTSALPYDQVEAVRRQLATLPISQAKLPQPETAITAPQPAPVPQTASNTEGLLESLRAAGLLTSPASSSTPAPRVSTPQPLGVNSNAANLRNSDLELTSASVQK